MIGNDFSGDCQLCQILTCRLRGTLAKPHTTFSECIPPARDAHVSRAPPYMTSAFDWWMKSQ